MNFRVLSRTDRYEIREVEVVVVLSLTHSHSLFLKTWSLF